MKICQKHWDMLRQAIKDRGLDHFGARNSDEVLENIQEELKGGKAEYDPLMDCNTMIWSQALKMGGAYLMEQKADGSAYCPICEALTHQIAEPGKTKDDQERWWINGPADAALTHCQELGLVPKVQ